MHHTYFSSSAGVSRPYLASALARTMKAFRKFDGVMEQPAGRDDESLGKVSGLLNDLNSFLLFFLCRETDTPLH